MSCDTKVKKHDYNTRSKSGKKSDEYAMHESSSSSENDSDSDYSEEEEEFDNEEYQKLLTLSLIHI